jgi:hypothetical protein
MLIGGSFHFRIVRAHGINRQLAQPLTDAEILVEARDIPPGQDAFEIKTSNVPSVAGRTRHHSDTQGDFLMESPSTLL